MRSVLENPEPLKNLASLIKAQQAFFAQAAESLASIQGKSDTKCHLLDRKLTLLAHLLKPRLRRLPFRARLTTGKPSAPHVNVVPIADHRSPLLSPSQQVACAVNRVPFV